MYSKCIIGCIVFVGKVWVFWVFIMGVEWCDEVYGINWWVSCYCYCISGNFVLKCGVNGLCILIIDNIFILDFGKFLDFKIFCYIV